jgi:hypothetical protein
MGHTFILVIQAQRRFYHKEQPNGSAGKKEEVTLGKAGAEADSREPGRQPGIASKIGIGSGPK